METTIEQNGLPPSNLPKLIDQSVKDVSMHIIKIFCYMCEISIKLQVGARNSQCLSIDALKLYMNLIIDSDDYLETFFDPIIQSQLLIKAYDETGINYKVTDNLQKTLTDNHKLFITFPIAGNFFRISYFRILQIYNDRKARICEENMDILALVITVFSRTPVTFKLTLEPPTRKFLHEKAATTAYTPFLNKNLSLTSHYARISEDLDIYNQLFNNNDYLQYINTSQQDEFFLSNNENIPPQSKNSIHIEDNKRLHQCTGSDSSTSKRRRPLSIIEMTETNTEPTGTSNTLYPSLSS